MCFLYMCAHAHVGVLKALGLSASQGRAMGVLASPPNRGRKVPSALGKAGSLGGGVGTGGHRRGCSPDACMIPGALWKVCCPGSRGRRS